MIRGKVASVQQSAVVVDVSGVGFLINVGTHALETLHEGSDVLLFTVMIVREDKMELYGFARESEKRFFEQLLKVSAVGPKTALTILSLGNLADVQQAIMHEDVAVLTSVPGVGKKTAERIILELKEKVFADDTTPSGPKAKSDAVVSALMHLGYSQREAREAVHDLPAALTTDDERVRWVLKQLGSQK